MKSLNFGKVFPAILLVCLLVTASGWAQTGTSSVRGVVTDKTGAAIVGARVTVVSAAQGLQREGATDGAGAYEFVGLPPGSYVLAIESKGFRRFEQKNLQLQVNSPATVNATLEAPESPDALLDRMR